MPDSIYFELPQPVYIDTVNGDVYFNSAPSPKVPDTGRVPVKGMPIKGGPGGLPRPDIQKSADALVYAVNSANQDALYWFVNGVTRLYLEGMGMGSAIANRVLKSAMLKERMRSLILSIGKLKKFEKSTLPSVSPSKYGALTVLPDNLTQVTDDRGQPVTSQTRFLQLYANRLVPLFLRGESSYNASPGATFRLTFMLANPQAEIELSKIAMEATRDPRIGAIVGFTSEVVASQEQEISRELGRIASETESVSKNNGAVIQSGGEIPSPTTIANMRRALTDFNDSIARAMLALSASDEASRMYPEFRTDEKRRERCRVFAGHAKTYLDYYNTMAKIYDTATLVANKLPPSIDPKLIPDCSVAVLSGPIPSLPPSVAPPEGGVSDSCIQNIIDAMNLMDIYSEDWKMPVYPQSGGTAGGPSRLATRPGSPGQPFTVDVIDALVSRRETSRMVEYIINAYSTLRGVGFYADLFQQGKRLTISQEKELYLLASEALNFIEEALGSIPDMMVPVSEGGDFIATTVLGGAWYVAVPFSRKRLERVRNLLRCQGDIEPPIRVPGLPSIIAPPSGEPPNSLIPPPSGTGPILPPESSISRCWDGRSRGPDSISFYSGEISRCDTNEYYKKPPGPGDIVKPPGDGPGGGLCYDGRSLGPESLLYLTGQIPLCEPEEPPLEPGPGDGGGDGNGGGDGDGGGDGGGGSGGGGGGSGGGGGGSGGGGGGGGSTGGGTSGRDDDCGCYCEDDMEVASQPGPAGLTRYCQGSLVYENKKCGGFYVDGGLQDGQRTYRPLPPGC